MRALSLLFAALSLAGGALVQPAAGPVVAIDEAHKNTHTYGGRQQGFVQLLEGDGYRVRPLTEAISRDSLQGVDVLFLGNPGGWEGPDASLNDGEVAALMEWVHGGGSLLLILDHMPAPGNAAKLTAALGVPSWHDGYAMMEAPDARLVSTLTFWRADSVPEGAPAVIRSPDGAPIYQGADAVLAKHPITEGRGTEQRVRTVRTFGGSAFRPPEGAEALIVLPRKAISLTPDPTAAEAVRWRDAPRTPGRGMAPGCGDDDGQGPRGPVRRDRLVLSGPRAGQPHIRAQRDALAEWHQRSCVKRPETLHMRSVRRFFFLGALLASPAVADAQRITAAGQPAQLDVRAAGERSIRVTLKPVSMKEDFPLNPAVASRPYPAPGLSLREITDPVRKKIGTLTIDIRPNPLTLHVTNRAGLPVQELVFETDGSLSFTLDEHPVLGMGEGGPRPDRGTPWREQPVQFDRRGRLDEMQPRWQADMYGSRNPAAMLLGTGGWGLFVAAPWGQVDLRSTDRGVFLPWKPTDAERAPQTQRNQQQALAKGLPPPDAVVPGLYDIFIFDAHDPAKAMKDFSVITGPAAMPPIWALGYMQSHRTLEDDAQILGIVETFREKGIPLDAVIYLGTGFIPRGWNTRQPSFDFNPDVFKRDPKGVIADMHAHNVKVVVHMVPWDRDRLPTLHGTIPARPDETLDESHIQNYWQQHVALVEAGIDAFWPDEGDWFNLFERIKRHQLYYQGHLFTKPNVRPWSLQRNGHPGIAQWGGWVWSGDTDSSWKTLEAQIAVGLNYSLSIGPYWGSDIGGFYPNNELTGELYARWFQFAAFCGSFRSHGRVWWTRLPWGWGLSDRGPQEYGNNNAPIPPDDRRNILLSEMNNPAIEPIAKKYAELRYQLLPYTYTLAWEARDAGMPLMRAMWLHYPDDVRARGLGSQFMWGRDLLVAPVVTKGATSREVYLPRGDWYDWWTNAKTAGGQTVTREVDLATMPMYVRAGAVVPFDAVRQSTSQPRTEPTTLRIYGGADGEYTLYEDDGISQDYLKARGTWTRITWNDRAKRLTIEPGAPTGATNVTARRVFRLLLLPEGATRDVTYTGARLQTSF